MGVAAGQELTNCYGPHYRRHAQADRQTMLREQYGFRCSCSACTDTSDRHFFSRWANLILMTGCKHSEHVFSSDSRR